MISGVTLARRDLLVIYEFDDTKYGFDDAMRRHDEIDKYIYMIFI